MLVIEAREHAKRREPSHPSSKSWGETDTMLNGRLCGRLHRSLVEGRLFRLLQGDSSATVHHQPHHAPPSRMSPSRRRAQRRKRASVQLRITVGASTTVIIEYPSLVSVFIVSFSRMNRLGVLTPKALSKSIVIYPARTLAFVRRLKIIDYRNRQLS